MKLDLKQISLGLVVIMFVSSAIGGLILWWTGFSFQIAYPLEAEDIGHWNEKSLLIPVDGAKSANINLEMKAGELIIDGSPEDQHNSEILYHAHGSVPKISHSVHNGVADIKISQASYKKRHFWDDHENKWNLQLNEDFPLNLTANLDLADADLRLGNLNLISVYLDISMGSVYVDLTENPTPRWIYVDSSAGDVVLNLKGDWKRDLNATVDTSIGDIELMLPSKTGVRIRADLDLGTIEQTGLKRMGEYYVNEAFGRSNSTLYLDLSADMGDIELR